MITKAIFMNDLYYLNNNGLITFTLDEESGKFVMDQDSLFNYTKEEVMNEEEYSGWLVFKMAEKFDVNVEIIYPKGELHEK